jgi:hypothetical protein
MIAPRQVMSLDMLRIVMIGLRPSYNYKGNHIITLGVTQAHNDNQKSKFKGFRPQIFDLRANFKDEIC